MLICNAPGEKRNMEKLFVTKLEIKKVRHLKDITINLSDTTSRHLIFTGKNGSGKTSVLDAIAAYLKMKFQVSDLNLAKTKEMDPYTLNSAKRCLTYFNTLNSSVKLSFNNETDINLKELYADGSFLLAYYKCDRNFQAEVPEHIEKVSLNDAYDLNDAPRNLFVKYLADLKVTEALARAKSNNTKADSINNWFIQFEKLLQQIFEDTTLKLDFNEDTFSFMICQSGKEPYDFNCMSSGFSAIMDIVLDLMIRMVKKKGRIFEFDLPGIVLIDEIETHLHLELQKQIMHILTCLFPNIQFIVSTHSPFVLNSLDNVVIYDLENHIIVENGLSDVPYDGIVKGYFQVDTLSDTLKNKFQQYKTLVQKPKLTDDDFEKIAELEMFLDEIPDYLALDITTEYQQLKEELAQREDI